MLLVKWKHVHNICNFSQTLVKVGSIRIGDVTVHLVGVRGAHGVLVPAVVDRKAVLESGNESVLERQQ